MLYYISHQIGEAFPLMIAGAAVMHITEGALDRVRAGTISRQKEEGKPRVGGQPVLHSLGLMDFIVIDHHIEPCIPLGWIARIEHGEQVPEQRVGFPWA